MGCSGNTRALLESTEEKSHFNSCGNQEETAIHIVITSIIFDMSWGLSWTGNQRNCEHCECYSCPDQRKNKNNLSQDFYAQFKNKICFSVFSGPIGEQRNRLITKEVQLVQRTGNMNNLYEVVDYYSFFCILRFD